MFQNAFALPTRAIRFPISNDNLKWWKRGAVFYILRNYCQNFLSQKKKKMVSVPYLTVFGFLLYSSLWVLRFYVGGLLSFIMSPIIIAGERLWRNLYISIAKLISMIDWKRAILFKKGIKWWFIIRINKSWHSFMETINFIIQSFGV